MEWGQGNHLPEAALLGLDLLMPLEPPLAPIKRLQHCITAFRHNTRDNVCSQAHHS